MYQNVTLYQFKNTSRRIKPLTNFAKTTFQNIQDSDQKTKILADQLRDKKLDIKVDRISTKNFRIQAQVLHFSTSRILWMNTYFPNDPGGELFDEEELFELL